MEQALRGAARYEVVLGPDRSSSRRGHRLGLRAENFTWPETMTKTRGQIEVATGDDIRRLAAFLRWPAIMVSSLRKTTSIGGRVTCYPGRKG